MLEIHPWCWCMCVCVYVFVFVFVGRKGIGQPDVEAGVIMTTNYDMDKVIVNGSSWNAGISWILITSVDLAYLNRKVNDANMAGAVITLFMVIAAWIFLRMLQFYEYNNISYQSLLIMQQAKHMHHTNHRSNDNKGGQKQLALPPFFTRTTSYWSQDTTQNEEQNQMFCLTVCF